MSERVVIAGGGTGGHIYPGLAVARVLADRGYDVHWVGAVGGLEESIVTRAELPLHLIRIGKLHHSVGLLARLKTVLGMPLAFIQALRLVMRLKPVAVLGVGGFASGPFLFVAALLRIRTVIWEPNAHAGMANRLLSRFVDECLVVFEAAADGMKGGRDGKSAYRVGLPVRASMRPVRRSPSAGRSFRVLVFGGSQGARAINKVVTDWVSSDLWTEGDIELIHQTGRYDFEDTKVIYERLWIAGSRKTVECHEYLHDMDARYVWADLIICRAGASTVAEIATCGKAAIFVPLPTAADNHQLKNAMVLGQAGAAVCIEQKDFTPDVLNSTIRRFQAEPSLLESYERTVRQFAIDQAAETIASHVIGKRVT
ncbi:MAG: undecaprenyldiphospho-muramoylpentapeptide beta-N-acetylglucosaminyltransferase [Bdellovibrionales bacterium]|jgi:UDP-N-acetylglucosamine--N-acetylmuramyl-(pentapeptide) pyrophosphoryl-undecaprenol N-acetylglucosamine transferase|nr:undecaprenyldiphospho-muramoylpentapeptide beta-N-acetylglucosaminyltransferase [Bdellovibrionales bacterium]